MTHLLGASPAGAASTSIAFLINRTIFPTLAPRALHLALIDCNKRTCDSLLPWTRTAASRNGDVLVDRPVFNRTDASPCRISYSTRRDLTCQNCVAAALTAPPL